MTKMTSISLLAILFTLLSSSNLYAQDAVRKTESGKEASLSAKATLDQIRKDARNDFSTAGRALRAMHPDEMNDVDRATWVRLSRESAVRMGDRDWLLALKGKEDPFSQVVLYRVLLAGAHINEGDFAAARAEFSRIRNLERANTRDQRRYWALQARLNQLEGKEVNERAAIEHIVSELGKWTSEDCQSCHEDLKFPGKIPLLEVQNFWFTKRYVELMQKQGDAENVRQAAEKKLTANPVDDNATIHLALALIALGKADEATTRFREIPWIAFPDRTGSGPRMMFAWP
jgi:tetratricopeptide (TPR) repeat protein